MKKFIAGFVLGALIFSSISVYATTQYIATKPTFKVYVDGKEFQPTTGEILVVEGRTYLPLLDMGNALGVPVKWNDEMKQVEVGTPPRKPIEVGDVISKHIPSDELFNEKDGMGDNVIHYENGEYYILVFYVGDLIPTEEADGYIDGRQMFDFSPNLDSQELFIEIEGEVVYHGYFIFVQERSYIPYDDFINIILPLIEQYK